MDTTVSESTRISETQQTLARSGGEMLSTDDGHSSPAAAGHAPRGAHSSRGRERSGPAPQGCRITPLPIRGRGPGLQPAALRSLDFTLTSSVADGTARHLVTEALPPHHYVLTAGHLPLPAGTKFIPSLGPSDEVLLLKCSHHKP